MTTSELLELPQTQARTERWLFEGELVERWNGAGFHSPGHAGVVARVAAILGDWCAVHNDHRAYGYGCPYLLERDPDTFVTFDASIVKSAKRRSQPSRAEYIERPPVLAVEVVDLDEDHDLLSRLIAVSLRCGIPAVWIIDPVEEIVVVHRDRQRPEYLNGAMAIQGGDALPGFRCSVAEIFE
jgi:Uma2 family endonuclease